MNKWLNAFLKILPVYLIVHAVFGLLTLFSALFILADFGSTALPLHMLIASWYRWDSGNYVAIATEGYAHHISRAAFFPLFPLLERVGTYLVHDPFVAGLLIANLADLGILIALYALVKEDFGDEVAGRSALYLSIFPSAFFLVAGYNEALFLFLALLSFYQIRYERYFLAGVFGFFACLTRSTGIFLLLPMAYGLLRRKQLRFDIFALALPLAGVGAYCLYCYHHFGNPLAWEYAQRFWSHQLMPPWNTLLVTIGAIKDSPGLLSFQALHNLLDLSQILFAIAMLIIGVRRLPAMYMVYTVPLLLALLCVPIIGEHPVPLQSMPRFMLEVFPVFIIAAGLGEQRWFHDGYVLLSASLLCLSCLLFLAGHWMV